MHTFLVAATLALASTVVAFPGRWAEWGNYGGGLNATGVQYLITGYTYLLEYPTGPNFNATANAILSDKFFVSSDSINTLSGRPLGVPAYPSKQAFILGQAQTPALPGLQTLGYFYSSDQIAWRWNVTQFGTRQNEIKGIITFDVNPQSLQIDAVYSEFNTIAFKENIPQ
ncbi:hypothetical protein, variant [Exophiala mesophila]|uniref:NTF2-like domain-containing protein n=1 Tax=Exophiala mesophila TaxID=212818 RepID=A0A0D2AEA2_EXOME|nr:uncharacterized protein PV10_01006 [Exophiala mesophila]XP_016228808.1 hypothetical protein, variant [Exophiala mesophila]KIV97233.1 hypothetical protein PV10_01006 [Exophiala mesophila]KIV97234.1 hypothetical protein, variant [Exophiala mesophila]